MDGNRRWAKKNGVSLKEECYKDWHVFKQRSIFVCQHNISYLSLYAFSIENLQRSALERACVFLNVLIEYGRQYASTMAQKGVHVRIVGDHDMFPVEVRAVCSDIEVITAAGSRLTLQFLFLLWFHAKRL